MCWLIFLRTPPSAIAIRATAATGPTWPHTAPASACRTHEARHYDRQHASPTAGAQEWAIERLEARTRATKEANLACWLSECHEAIASGRCPALRGDEHPQPRRSATRPRPGDHFAMRRRAVPGCTRGRTTPRSRPYGRP